MKFIACRDQSPCNKIWRLEVSSELQALSTVQPSANAHVVAFFFSAMSNTRRFNQRIQALQISRNSSSIAPRKNRRQRGPAHGLLGDVHSQRSSSFRSTTALRHSQVSKLKKKGAAAEVLVLVENMSDVIEKQSYPPVQSATYRNGDFDGPAEDFSAETGNWVDENSDNSDEEGGGEDEVERVARKMKVEYRDFRTRRQRTDTSNRYWEEQQDDLVSAFMEWSLRQRDGGQAPPGNRELWVEVIDIFGEPNCERFLSKETDRYVWKAQKVVLFQ